MYLFIYNIYIFIIGIDSFQVVVSLNKKLQNLDFFL